MYFIDHEKTAVPTTRFSRGLFIQDIDHCKFKLTSHIKLLDIPFLMEHVHRLFLIYTFTDYFIMNCSENIEMFLNKGNDLFFMCLFLESDPPIVLDQREEGLGCV